MENRDRNLLFGVLAVQAGMITPAQLAAAGGAWATDPSKDLASQLAERGQLRAGDRELVDRLVDRAIEAHGGDPGATLTSFGGDASVIHSFAGSLVRSESGGVHTILSPGEVSSALGDGSVPGVIETAGRYSTHSEYARGGMGRVLLVHDEHLGRDIALKELLPELSGKSGPDSGPDPGTPVRQSMPFLKRFLQEARITGQLEHPSIVPVYELGRRLDGSVYYTMKLVRGKTLGHAIAGARGIEERLRLLPHFVDLCQAIAYAHNRRVIHRDIKPGNVMVGEFGETVVLDWGLAKVTGKEDAHATGLAETLHALRLGDEKALGATQYGEALGTPVYMPPEQAKGYLEQIDERSDVYSLGAVLFEILAGVPPFDGKTLHHILRQVIEETPQSIATLEPKAPPELVAIAMRALSKDPAKRYQSAKELAEEVQRFQSGALVGAYQYTPREVIGRFVKKHRALIGATAAAVLAIVAIGTFSYVSIVEDRNSARKARTTAEVAKVESEAQREKALHDSYRAGLLLAQSLIQENKRDEANAVLWGLPTNLRGWEWRHLLYQTNYRHRWSAKVNPEFSGLNDAVFSPDGRLIVLPGRGYSPIIYRVEDGAEVQALVADSIWQSDVRFSDSGSFVIARSDSGRLSVWSGSPLEPLFIVPFTDPTRFWVNSSENRLLTATIGTGLQNSGKAPGELHATAQAIARLYQGLQIWDMASGRLLSTLRTPEELAARVPAAGFTDGGSRVIVVENDALVRFDGDSGKTVARTNLASLGTNFGFNSTGTYFIERINENELQILDTGSGAVIQRLPIPRTGVSVAFSPDGNVIVDGLGCIWSLVDGSMVHDLTDSPIKDIRFAKSGAYFSAIVAGDVCQWEFPSGAVRNFYDSVANDVDSYAISPTNDVLAVYSPGTGAVELVEWDQEERPFRKLSDTELPVAYNFDPQGGRVTVCSFEDGRQTVLDSASGKELASLGQEDDKDQGVMAAEFGLDGAVVVIGGASAGVIEVWDSGTYTLTRVLNVADDVLTKDRNFDDALLSHALSPSGELVAFIFLVVVEDSVGNARSIWIEGVCDLTSGKILWKHQQEVIIHEDELMLLLVAYFSAPDRPGSPAGIQFSRDGNLLLTSRPDGESGTVLTVWNADSGVAITTYHIPAVPILCAKFSEDATKLLMGLATGRVVMWDISGQQELAVLDLHDRGVLDIHWNADETGILTASVDGTVKLTFPQTHSRDLVLEGHTGWVLSAAYVSDHTRIVSSSTDGTIRWWDASSGAELLTLKEADAEGQLNLIPPNFSPDGNLMLAGTRDGLYAWRAAPIDAVSEEWKDRIELWKRRRPGQTITVEEIDSKLGDILRMEL